MRTAHFSDLHYGATTLEEADRCFGAAIDRAIVEQVEAAVLSGDATDHGLGLHEPATLRLLAQVRRLADHCPILMLQGTFSHEPPGTLAVFGLLGARHPVHVAERIEQVALTAQGRWLASDGWCFEAVPSNARALLSCVPTINKAVVAATVGAADAAWAIDEHLALLLAGFAPIHQRARAQGIATITVSHGTVFGSLSEHGVPMAGFDHEFSTGVLFGAGSQAVMPGHIHRHQRWEHDGAAGHQCIAYAGSIGRSRADLRRGLSGGVEPRGADADCGQGIAGTIGSRRRIHFLNQKRHPCACASGMSGMARTSVSGVNPAFHAFAHKAP